MGAEKGARRINLDDILTDELGQFGLFQLKTLLLALGIVIFMSWGANEYVFTTARINTRCLIPECDGAQPEFSPGWLENAIPGTGSSFEGCERFRSAGNFSHQPACPAHMFNKDHRDQCEERLYENTHSIVYDYDLGCEEWQRSLIGSLRTAGTLTALPITGYISDRFGRRVALVFNAINTAWLGATRYFAGTYVGFVISEFAEATFGSGGFSCAYVLVTEVVGPKYRVAAGATLNTFFSVGQITMGLIAWGVPDWKNLTLTLYIPQVLSFAYLWIISESVRWYMSKGHYDKAEKVLNKIAQVNRKQLSEKSLAALRATAEEEKQNALIDKTEKAKEPWLVVQVFRNKKILLRCVISPIWWITNLFIYYGMSINSVNMSGNRYLNYMAVSAAQVPGYWAAVLLLDRLGRRPVLVIAFWIGAACQTAYIVMPEDMPGASLAVYLIGSCSSAMTMTAVYVYTLELYPTRYRHSLFAFSSMMGRVGSILAPLTPALGEAVWDKLPFALFGALALLSGALIFLTPETLGAALPDTFEEAADIGNPKKKRVDI
ncbi:organic cation transporter protein-like [Plodia interpunctella]|uniref:organic cation transporter protein-like n=1 Tax=Plodia interpunctella TaxID=58824 RepID=UPI0023679ED7|nr:organic cation transporter protein-like [Plodia interpunctella]XP_053604727.1 organic cation transporter protein-like [Plodia interpunctella]